jgi:hypothetical protein
MEECEVKNNCKTYLEGRNQCWICENYSLYNPVNPKILSKRQIQEKEERKAKKKELKNSEASRRGKRAKRKGWEGETEVVKLLEKYGIKAERVPLSGMLKSEKYSCDVVLENGKRIEVKRRKSGLKTIQNWLNEDPNSNYVFFREDGDKDKWIVIMPVMEFIGLIQKIK